LSFLPREYLCVLDESGRDAAMVAAPLRHVLLHAEELDAAVLRAAVPHLQGLDYDFVELFKSEKDDPQDDDLWWLHVQRIEVHTVDSLFARNERLYEFASSHGLDSYDGMDVGPAPVVERPA